MTNRAPGPWFVDMESRHFVWTDSISIGYIDEEYGGGVSHVAHLTRGIEDGPSLANAHLIAAAPDMLEALREALRWGRLPDRAEAQVRHAITLAEGR